MINKVTTKGKLTCRKLQQEDKNEWKQWLQTEHVMLEDYHPKGMYGKPIRRPINALVMKPLWTYIVKTDGNKKACQV